MNMSGAHNKPTLKASNISKTYSGRKVVSDVSFNVNPGEVVGLLGPNGAGKTTSFYAVVGLVNPDDGDIIFEEPEEFVLN